MGIGIRSASDAPALDGLRLDALLRRAIPQVRSGAWAILSCEVTQVRVRWKSRVMFCLLTYCESGADDPLALRVVIKQAPNSQIETEAATLEALERAGLRAPSRYQVPHLLGMLPSEGIMVQLEAPGTSLRSFLANPRLPATHMTSAARAAAHWLVRFQSISLADERPLLLCAEPCESLESLIADLRHAFPHHLTLAGVLDQVSALPPLPEERLVLSHGDFHPGQTLVDPRHTTTVVDFENVGWRSPGFDVGTCLAQLLAMAWFDTGDARPGVSAARAFWRAYAREGCAIWPAVRFHCMRALLQVLHFALASPRRDESELLAQWTWLLTSLLSSRRDEDLWRQLTAGRPQSLPSVGEAGGVGETVAMA